MPSGKSKKQFGFGPGRPKRKNTQQNTISEETLREDNPQWAELAKANDLARQREEVRKQKIKAADHAQIHMYLAIVFQSREQKLEFLSHFPDVLCVDEVFIDGESFSEQVGVQITPNELPPIKTPISARLLELTEKY